MPNMDLSAITIVRCDKAQTIQSRKNHFVQWGQPLGFDEQGWLDRFTSMEKGGWADNDRYITWALVPRSDTGTTNLLAHCETFKRKSIIQDANSQPKEVFSYGIASVYTPANNRGKGYARYLLQLVHYLIAPSTLLPPFPYSWDPKPDIGPMDAEFSILFSGIGDKYYASCRQGEGAESKPGWIRQPITARTWDVSEVSSSSDDVNQDGWKWLNADELESLETEAADDLRRSLSGKDVDDQQSTFLVLPEWSLLRVHAVRSELSPASKKTPGRPYGLVLPAPQPGAPRPFVTFTYPEGQSDEPTLRITYLRHPIPFEAIAAAARKAGCSKVSMWGDRGGWDDQKPDLDTESEMPCYVIYGRDTENLLWKGPEAYTWC